MSIANQRILIVGGTSGMRLASAKHLVQAGAEVFVAGRDAAKLEAAVKSLGAKTTGIERRHHPDGANPGQGTGAAARERGLAGPGGYAAYDGMPAEAKAGMFAAAVKSLPVGRTGVPDDIAQCVEMLVSNTFATGMVLDIDGGARTPL